MPLIYPSIAAIVPEKSSSEEEEDSDAPDIAIAKKQVFRYEGTTVERVLYDMNASMKCNQLFRFE